MAISLAEILLAIIRVMTLIPVGIGSLFGIFFTIEYTNTN
jgi:hypothetical protein